jgi:hypothetical protein
MHATHHRPGHSIFPTTVSSLSGQWARTALMVSFLSPLAGGHWRAEHKGFRATRDPVKQRRQILLLLEMGMRGLGSRKLQVYMHA